jgi:PhnB protein
MTLRLNPYLNFDDGKARAALEFYRSVFGGELAISTFGQFGAPDPSLADKVMHGQLETPSGFTLMGSDLPPGMPYAPGNNLSVSLSGAGSAESEQLHGHWDALSDGGTITTALEKQMWGDEFGSLTDKFGINWLVNIAAG